MPTWKYRCSIEQCLHEYERFFKKYEDRASAKCPKCGAGKQDRLFSLNLSPAGTRINRRDTRTQPATLPIASASGYPRVVIKDSFIGDGMVAFNFDRPGFLELHNTTVYNVHTGFRQNYANPPLPSSGLENKSITNWNSGMIKINDSTLRAHTVFDLTKNSTLDVELNRTSADGIASVVRERDAASLIQQLGFPEGTSPHDVADMLQGVAAAGSDPVQQEKAAKESALGRRLANYASISTIIQGVVALAISPAFSNVLTILLGSYAIRAIFSQRIAATI